jgi:outer membrane lipopolysaccharide assembly protein LptE/RlpB
MRGEHDRIAAAREGTVIASRARSLVIISMLAALLLTTACGYHTNGSTAVRLPSDVHTIYVQGIQNASQTYHVGQTFTEAVVRELRERTNYRIISTNDGSEDAVLAGTITSVYTAPLTYDSTTGSVSTSLVVVTLNARLVDKNGKVLWSNPSFVYREQYQLSTDVSSFFEEEQPALQRIANSFSKTLVADILEAF